MEPAARTNIIPVKADPDIAALRTPPHNFEAEMALLGAILANRNALEKVRDFLQPEHFADGRHGRIYAACVDLDARGMLANPVTLKNYFEQDNALAEVGGHHYLARLAGSVVTVINVVDYARVIHDLHLRRQLIALGEDVVNDAHSFDLDVSAIQQIESAEEKLFKLAETGELGGKFKPFASALNAAIEAAGAAFSRDSHITGVTTGLRDLDAKLGGLHKSDLVILAGRPSMGKTALATKIAFSAASAYKERRLEDGSIEVVEGAKVAFFSLEMSAEQLATRILSEESQISSHKIRQGDLKVEDFTRFVEVTAKLHRIPLFIDDTPALSVSAVRTRARRLQRQHGLGMIVIDYLQLLTPPSGQKSENRVQEISAITRALKAIAKELNVPVLALSQLSRAVEQREDKRPQLADLRESGTIEQDADVVMFVYREQYYHERAEPSRRAEESEEKFNDRFERWKQRAEEIHNTAEVIIGKQRHGPIGNVRLYFDGDFTKFDNLAQSDHYPDAE